MIRVKTQGVPNDFKKGGLQQVVKRHERHTKKAEQSASPDAFKHPQA
jgi:hypothetical protein